MAPDSLNSDPLFPNVLPEPMEPRPWKTVETLRDTTTGKDIPGARELSKQEVKEKGWEQEKNKEYRPDDKIWVDKNGNHWITPKGSRNANPFP